MAMVLYFFRQNSELFKQKSGAFRSALKRYAEFGMSLFSVQLVQSSFIFVHLLFCFCLFCLLSSK